MFLQCGFILDGYRHEPFSSDFDCGRTDGDCRALCGGGNASGAKADAAKQAIDNATTNAAVEQAKANGTTEVNNVNPTAQAKPAVKKAIDDALKAKNDAIDARTD